MTSQKLVASRTALFLLDYQVMHAKKSEVCEAVMIRTAPLIQTARNKGITIAHCRVAFTEAEAASVPDTNPVFSALKNDPARAAALHVDSPVSAFHPAVGIEDGDIVIRKNRVGPFINAPQDTHSIFKQRGIDTLIIGGVSTGGAVLSTVVQAFDLDYRLFVVEDACADSDPETHDFLVKFLAKRATIIRSDQLKALF